MKTKKIIIGILCLILVLVGIILLIVKSKDNKNQFDLDIIQESIMNEYKELDIRVLDQYDISMYFGIDFNDIPSSIFLSDYVEDPDNPQAFAPKILIAVINTEEYQNYYDLLYDFLDVNKNNIEDKEKVKIYENAILKKGKKYVYLIMGDKAKEIEKKLIDLKDTSSN